MIKMSSSDTKSWKSHIECADCNYYELRLATSILRSYERHQLFLKESKYKPVVCSFPDIHKGCDIMLPKFPIHGFHGSVRKSKSERNSDDWKNLVECDGCTDHELRLAIDILSSYEWSERHLEESKYRPVVCRFPEIHERCDIILPEFPIPDFHGSIAPQPKPKKHPKHFIIHVKPEKREVLCYPSEIRDDCDVILPPRGFCDTWPFSLRRCC